MTGNGQTATGMGAGSLTAIANYLVQHGFKEELSIIYAAAMGAVVGFIVTEFLKFIKKKITNNKKDV